MTSRDATAVLIPIKDFGRAKGRLGDALEPAGRADLARRLAATVVAAARPLPAYVVCDDDEVAMWCETSGATVLWRPASGLSEAVSAGIDALRAEGVRRAVISHSDLPLATELAWVADWPGVTIVPDRHLDGTNVMSVPTDADFVFRYGPGSFHGHIDETARCRLGLRVRIDAALGWDVDHPADLTLPDGRSLVGDPEPAGGPR
ncbi:MAG: hypothetical protein OEU32_07835 [Acidimicrobiia bacterium]|nr:hypothetical protein [Acidimicrobiia bacterium]